MPEESLQTETATVNDETTSDVETPKTDAPQTDPLEAAVAHRARILRRIGFAIFGGILVTAAAYLTYSTFHDMAQKQVYDPFTGENVMTK